MVPTIKKAKKGVVINKKKGKTRAVTVKAVNNAQHRLDDAATKWLRLIRDPCGADLTVPCYAGTGEGYLIRSKDIISIPATAVDGLYEFTPSANYTTNLRYGWSDTVGGALGTASAINVCSFLASTVVGRFRPAAACIKVFYIGTELERKGQVGLNLSAGSTLLTGELINTSAPGVLPSCGLVERTPAKIMEVKWAPTEQDSHWIPSTDESYPLSPQAGNSLTVAFSGVPAGSLRLEVTTVWEWQPAEELTAGLVTSAKGPASRNHINEILYALGEIGKFAYGYAVPRVPQLAQAMAAFM